MHDLKLAFRTISRTPLVSAVAILSLALGIGANGAIFSLFDQIVLRPLPVPAPERLVNLGAPGPKPGSQSCNNAGDCDQVFSYPMFRDLEREQGVFTGLAAHRTFSANLAFEGQTLSGEGMLVSGSYFPTLGLQPALGRLLGPQDDPVIGQPLVAVLSHGYWRTRFDSDPQVLDKTIVVNGQTLQILGVAPAGFRGTTLGKRPAVFVPVTLRGLMSPGWEGFENRRKYWLYLFARVEPGVGIEQARSALRVPYSAILANVEAPLQHGMSEATLQRFLARELTITEGAQGQSSLRGEARAPLMLLFGVAAVVLLIACANVANLLLARSASRAGEIAVRLSIGASRSRLIAQLLTESCLLAAFGGLAGLLMARWTLALIASLLPADAVASFAFGVEPSMLLFAALLALGTGILFGIFPALHSTRLDLASTLKGQAGQPSGARTAARLRFALVTAQIALSTALLVTAGLFTKSLTKVGSIDLGLEVDRLATFAISPELNGYSPARARTLFVEAEEALAAIPGVERVTASLVPVLTGSNWGTDVSVEGFEADSDTDRNARYNEIGPGYFRTMGVPLLAGREITAADTAKAPKVAIINQAFAKKFHLGREVIGKRMATSTGDVDLDIEIIGLVPDVKYSEIKTATPPVFYAPYRQDDALGAITFYLRTAGAPERLLAAIPPVMARLDPNLPVEALKTMPQQVRESLLSDRVLGTLSAAFATVATLLAAIGLYGVLAYTVSQRTRELGLRMVLGADAAKVRGLVLAQVGRMTLLGAFLGIALALGLGRLARSQLFELEGYDPVVLAGSLLLLGLVALTSGLLPAIKAARVQPMRVLRYE